MSEAHRRAQQLRRQRERQDDKSAMAIAAGAAADAAAAAIPDDAPTEEQPESAREAQERRGVRSGVEWRMQALQELRGRPEDPDEVEQQLSDFSDPPAKTDDSPPPDTLTGQGEVTITEAAPEPAQETPQMVRVKVNGEERDVPQSEIDEYGGIRSYQRQKGLELELERSKENNKRTHELLQHLTQLAQAQQPPPQPQRTLIDLAKEKAPLIQFGTPEESAAALNDLLTAAVPRIDENKIVANAVSAMSRQSAVEEFITQNPDIVGNQYLMKLAAFEENVRLQQSLPSNWRKFYADLANEIRNGVGVPNPTAPTGTTQPTSPNPTGTVADKAARKADIVALPIAGGRMPAPEEVKPMSRDDKLSALRKARGLV